VASVSPLEILAFADDEGVCVEAEVIGRVDNSAAQEVIAKATSSASDGFIFSKQRLQGFPYSKRLEQKQALFLH